jgi:hypothetical protein
VEIVMRTSIAYHPIEAEAFNCFALKLGMIFEHYFRALRERIVGLAERDGMLPPTFWTNEQETLSCQLSGLYEAGLRLGMEFESSPHATTHTLISLNSQVQRTVHDLAQETAEEVTATKARQVDELLHMGVNPQGLPDRLRHELRAGIVSDSDAAQIAAQQAIRVVAAGRLLARRTPKTSEWLVEAETHPKRVCI